MGNKVKSRESTEVMRGLIADQSFHQRRICHRCGGLTVSEFCMDLLWGTGELEFLASCCVQCGEVDDPVILMNRRIQRSSTTRSLFGSVGVNT